MNSLLSVRYKCSLVELKSFLPKVVTLHYFQSQKNIFLTNCNGSVCVCVFHLSAEDIKTPPRNFQFMLIVAAHVDKSPVSVSAVRLFLNLQRTKGVDKTIAR